jgi:hypothetical protein
VEISLRLTRGGEDRKFFKNYKSGPKPPNQSKLSEKCPKPFLSSKQSASSDKNMF